MEQKNIDMFMAVSAKYFAPEKMMIIKNQLEKMDDSRLMILQSVSYKDPTTLLLISIFAGGLGVDRFMLGQTGLGVLKLITFGGLGIWALIDWFTASNRAKEFNYVQFCQFAA
jgi:TM2 domain-containing membrane protein YozV